VPGRPAERLHVLSIGSRQATATCTWHLAPLPPGVPFEQQQLAALDTDRGLDIGEGELEELAGLEDAVAVPLVDAIDCFGVARHGPES
jgi:hypothetical protein